MSEKLAIITGVGRKKGIGFAIAQELMNDGYDLVISYWSAYDERLGLDRSPTDFDDLKTIGEQLGRSVHCVEVDLADPHSATELVDRAFSDGEVRALVMSHCESVDSGVLTTSLEAWDQHFAVNARAPWLLIKRYAELSNHDPECIKSVIALTSDHTAHNLPYGASKGALDRLVIASGVELGSRGFRCNVLNPGPVNTGWMTGELEQQLTAMTPAGRLGTTDDVAHLVSFLCSEKGSWVHGQLLHTNGGFNAG